MRPVITIDGLSGTGKTTLAKLLAQKLGFQYLRSGFIYRAVGLVADRIQLSRDNSEQIEQFMNAGGWILDERNGKGLVRVAADELFEEELESARAGELASEWSAIPAVRKGLLDAQRRAYPNANGIVAEGRDMGTEVFPEAPVKFFVTVPHEVKINRKLEQLRAMGDTSSSYDSLSSVMGTRDERDSTRPISPTVPAPGAIIIENSGTSLTEVVDRLYSIAASQLCVSGKI